MLFKCSFPGEASSEDSYSSTFSGSLSDVLDRMSQHVPSPGEFIDVVMPFYRIDLQTLKRIGQCAESFVRRGAIIRTLNFDPKKCRGRARMEHSVVGEAADIGDEGVQLLYQIFTSRRTSYLDADQPHIAFSLESLHLGHCSIEQTGVVFLTKMLARLPNLQSLHLSDNEGIGSNFVHLAEQLQSMSKLKEINLTQCSLGSHGAKVLSAILPYMPTLEKLHLTYNHISSGSMARVCAQFSQLTNLSMLFLSYNALGNSSDEAKASNLSKSQSLRLPSTQSSIYLDSSLSFCLQLTVLHVHHCTLGESGTCFLLENAVSQRLTCLQSLRIDHNGVQPNSTRFLNAMISAIGALKRIEQLWFRQVGLHFIEKIGLDRLDESSIPTSTSGMNAKNARRMLEEFLKCERMCFDTRSIDDDVFVTLAIAFNRVSAPRDWNCTHCDKTFYEISEKMFSITIDLAESGSIKEIYESNIILHEKIGQGGFGTVHKATWIHAQGKNELVAVKIVPFHPDDEELEAELSIMNKVKDGRVENLVHVKALYFFEKQSPSITPARTSQQSHMGIVMNWYEDGSLRALLTRTQHHKKTSVSLSWSDKLQLCLDVCNGLDKLHEMHLLHRDVKADNVLLKNSDGRMRGYLCDFGISASRESVNVRKQKGVILRYHIIASYSHGSSFGTLIFCAPELFGKGSSKFSVQSDIYAYGMFLYEVMTHHFPFENFVTESPDGSVLSHSKQHWSMQDIHKPHANDKLAQRYHRAAQANLCIPEAVRLESPNGFVELLKHCIAFDALHRPANMSQVRIALETIREEHLASSSPKASVPSRRRHDLDLISVEFSVEQISVMAEVLGTDSSGSLNVTSSMRSLIASQSSDAVERKRQTLTFDGIAADAASDASRT